MEVGKVTWLPEARGGGANAHPIRCRTVGWQTTQALIGSGQEEAGRAAMHSWMRWSGVEGHATQLVGERNRPMGRRRKGRRERARVKKRHRSLLWCSSWGAGTSFARMGAKKWRRHDNCHPVQAVTR